ncbi:MAG: hypothetical protein KUG68_11160 [Flavobacteriaceae bacterium]|nr:hypothetical protein [Flavobacteriaceae bacterium]
MKKNTSTYIIIFFALICFTTNTLAQVGINTTDPKGILDVNSSTTGLVYPNVALTAANVSSPVVNPQGGALVDGTVVYNTNTTFTGTTNDVYPGIYTWHASSSKWLIHYKKRQSELFNQTSLLRTQADAAGGYEDIPGLGVSDANTFTAKYSGLYRIEVKSIFGAGRTYKNTSMYVALASGSFRFAFDIDNDGTSDNSDFETSAYSAYSSYISPGSDTYYEDIWVESYDVFYVNLTADAIYPFSLTFDAYDAPGFINNGSTTGVPSSVDLINEDFEGSYTVTQSHTSDPQCSTDGWEINSNNSCTDCPGDHLSINGANNNCTQDATAYMSFTPTVNTVYISFDYRFRERSGKFDSFRVYLHDGTSQVGADLVNIDNSGSVDTNASYNGSATVVAGTPHTIRFEYINGVKQARYASVDNVIISELSGPSGASSDLGRAYVGNEADCQIEFTYIGE